MLEMTTTVQLATSVEAVRKVRCEWHEQSVAFVPTMGALHEGHRALIQMARAIADRVVVSIYVNPLQFGANEDLGRYPRTFEADLLLCRELGVDLVFTPDDSVMYPEGRDVVTKVVPPVSLSAQLCGLSRPGHFEGVATVVLKLFEIVQPTKAIFGEKDAQQLAVIRTMVHDFELPIEIIAHPTVREPDGLALSSRNNYFTTPHERQAALILTQTLKSIKERFETTAQSLPAQSTLEAALAQVLARPEFNTPGTQALFRLDYLAAVCDRSFQPVEILMPDTRVLMAAYVGNVRLIDNLLLA